MEIRVARADAAHTIAGMLSPGDSWSADTKPQRIGSGPGVAEDPCTHAGELAARDAVEGLPVA